MEKSHHAAKASTQQYSQHGGTTVRTSVIVQQYQFWYRNIQHRYARKLEKKLRDAEASQTDPVVVNAEARRRDAWYASNAATACESWRDGCVRDARRYVETVDELLEENADECAP